MAQLLDLYDLDVLDDDGEPQPVIKANDEFFERVVGLLPMHIKTLHREHLIRCLEVSVKRGLGSERLFRDYLLLKIEKTIMKLEVGQYCRLLRALADKQYVEDAVFWNEYVYKFLYQSLDKSPLAKDKKRTFTSIEAHKLWDALIYLRLKCPTLDLKDQIAHVE